jgi:ELWxxDGT repeat protein
MIFWYTFLTEFDCALVADINPGSGDALQVGFGMAPRRQFAQAWSGRLYFQANDGTSGAELWRTTETGVELVADIEPGPAGSAPHAFAVFNNALYFAATTAATGEALFRYDGTSVSLAAETVPGPAGAKINGLTVYNGALYFTRLPEGELVKVWRFDGIGAAPVTAINQFPSFGSIAGTSRLFVVFKGRLYYVLISSQASRYQLWCFDGSVAEKIKDLTPQTYRSLSEFDLGVFDDGLYFGVLAPAPGGEDDELQGELWRYDGQSSLTKMATLTSTPDQGIGLTPRHFVTFDNRLYFTAGGNLFSCDGATVENVSSANSTIPSAVSMLSTFNVEDDSRLFMTGAADGDDTFSHEPYLFDGIEATLIENIMPDAAPIPGSYPTFATQSGDRLYFYAEDEAHGRELWSVTASHVLEINAVLIPIWEDKLKWPVEEGVNDLALATYLVTEREAPRLLARTLVQLPSDPDRLEVPIIAIDRRASRWPRAFALLSVVFDRRGEDRLDVGVQHFGISTENARTTLARQAASFGRRLSLSDVMTATVSR